MALPRHPLHIAALASPPESERLETLLSSTPHQLRCFPDYGRLAAYLGTATGVQVVFLDIDAQLSQDQVLELAFKHPEATLFCLSSRKAHPEFKKAMQEAIFACLTKPLSKEELHFFLNSIQRPENM